MRQKLSGQLQHDRGTIYSLQNTTTSPLHDSSAQPLQPYALFSPMLHPSGSASKRRQCYVDKSMESNIRKPCFLQSYRESCSAPLSPVFIMLFQSTECLYRYIITIHCLKKKQCKLIWILNINVIKRFNISNKITSVF